MPLAAQEDVEARIGRDLTSDEESRLPGLLDEAAAIVEAGWRCGEIPVSPIPPNVVLVVSRMVGRVFKQGEGDLIPPGVDTTTQTAGPYGQTRTYSSGASQGGPWLNKVDRMLLRKVCASFGSGAAFNVPMYR